MEPAIKHLFDKLGSADDKVRMEAFDTVLAMTGQKVDWVYEVWDDLLAKLDHENSYQRTIAVKVLCHLAKSDHEHRLNRSIDRILAHTKDEKFITSRQALQSIWQIAIDHPSLRETILQHLENCYRECITEKHYNLLRQDALQSMLKISRAEKDDALLEKIKQLIAEESDAKHRKLYATLIRYKKVSK